MSGITYRFKGKVATVNRQGYETVSWNTPQKFTVYASSAGEACDMVKDALGDPDAGHRYGFRFSSMEEVVYP